MRRLLRHRRPTADRGFTLIELLVVIGIIALLVGLLLAGLVHARKVGAKTRMTADLALIGTALEAYKADFTDYPRFTLNNANDYTPASSINGSGSWLDGRQDRGAVLLCRCLLGPGPAGDPTINYAKPGDDGAAGLGFRATRNVTTYGGTPPDQFTGKVFGPYIQSDKFQVGGVKDPTSTYFNQDTVLLDTYGNPILYFPGLPSHGPLSATNAYVANFNPQTQTPSAANLVPLYNTYDNLASGNTGMPLYLSTAEMQFILGERSTAGTLAATETPVTTAPYLLWTAGPDGIYGRGPDGKTDDVTNFDMPSDLAK